MGFDLELVGCRREETFDVGMQEEDGEIYGYLELVKDTG